jgi:hypothetical protein
MLAEEGEVDSLDEVGQSVDVHAAEEDQGRETLTKLLLHEEQDVQRVRLVRGVDLVLSRACAGS